MGVRGWSTKEYVSGVIGWVVAAGLVDRSRTRRELPGVVLAAHRDCAGTRGLLAAELLHAPPIIVYGLNYIS